MQCAYCTYVMADPPDPFCPNCGTATLDPRARRDSNIGNALYNAMRPMTRPTPVSVSGVGLAASVLLICVGLAQLGYGLIRMTGTDTLPIAVITAVLELATLIVFLTWFYRAHTNAGLWGPQRHSRGWAVAGWLVPVVSFWFPFQMTNDIWRASVAPTEQRRRPARIVRTWWAFLILASVSGITIHWSSATYPDGSTQKHIAINDELGGTLFSNLTAAIAAVCGAAVVSNVTRMQKARLAA